MKESQVYENVQTNIEGVELRVVKDTRPEIPEEIIKLFYEVAREYAKTKEESEVLSTKQKERREKLIKFVKSLPGLRGIRSLPDDFNLLVVKKEEVVWDRNLLRASLGVAYQTLVSEDLVATIMIPPGVTTEEELRKGLSTFLQQQLKVPAEDVGKLMNIATELRIDLEKLEELEATNRVTLLPGAKDIEEKWAIQSERLKTPQKKKKIRNKNERKEMNK